MSPTEPAQTNAVAFVDDSFWHRNIDDRWTATDRSEDHDLDDWAALVEFSRAKDGRDPLIYILEAEIPAPSMAPCTNCEAETFACEACGAQVDPNAASR